MEQIITLILSIIGVGFAAFSLLVSNKATKRHAPSSLWVFIGLLSLILVVMHTITYYANWENPLFNFLSLIFYVLLISVPPFFYTYLDINFPSKKKQAKSPIDKWIHFIPSFILFVINVSGFAIISLAKPDSVFYENTEQIVFFLNFTIVTFFFILQNTFYLLKAALLLQNIKKHTSINSSIVIRWIRIYILSYLVFLAAAYTQQITFAAYTGWTLTLIFASFIGFLIYHSYNKNKFVLSGVAIDFSSSNPKRSEEEALIDNKLADSIQKKLMIAIHQDKIYQQPDLSLSSLSKAIDTNDKYLRYVISRSHRGGFVSFVNQYRVEEAKNMLSDEANSIYTVESIGQTSGFKSKSSFYAAFKEITGMTPFQYRNYCKKNKA